MARGRRKRVDWHVLGRADLTKFDSVSTDIILTAMARGGLGRITSNGHAFLRAPDGRTMSVAAKSNKSQQVLQINLRKLFPDPAEAFVEPTFNPSPVTPADQPPLLPERKEPAMKPNEPGAPAAPASSIYDSNIMIECQVKGCNRKFATEGAWYSHIHADHRVCPEPGCNWATDHPRGLSGHMNIVHRGIVPRRIAKEKGRQRDVRGRALAGPAGPDEKRPEGALGGGQEALTPAPVGDHTGEGPGGPQKAPERRGMTRAEAAKKGAEARWAKYRADKEAAGATEETGAVEPVLEPPVPDIPEPAPAVIPEPELPVADVPVPTRPTVPRAIRAARNEATLERGRSWVASDTGRDLLGEYLASQLRRLDVAIGKVEEPANVEAVSLLARWVTTERHHLEEQIENRDKRIAELEAQIGDLQAKLAMIREVWDA